ncbi:hypothetical protein PXH78_33565, partial [Mycolicibacterium smegmatis]|nr:hypothetical protein [Mycolicibacterium smegmatis]MDF1922219.1 hypothetical protein [Mycolicibacterium smegmatis]MDF1928777.1 hypothetical protein [Mycolicibacterium smegmatis]
PPTADPETESVPDTTEPPAADPTHPFHTSIIEVLRRSVESAQYTAVAFTERLAAEGILPSVGSVGDSFDNALAESVNSS